MFRRPLPARSRVLTAACLVAAALVPAGCGGGGSGGADAGSVTLRLGYFPNVTHAPAIVAIEEGLLARALGPGVKIELSAFNSGTEASEALFAGAIDATFIGPNPAINGFAVSDGDVLRIVAGTTSGGASLVVRDGIESVEDLPGTTLATPSLGNTQDVALRAWLAENGLEADTTGGGDVSIRPQENADTLTAFVDGQIDGAWVPEPWATRLVREGAGKRLLDERSLWPGGRFVSTHLVVATSFLEERPTVVRGLIEALLDSLDAIEADPARARTVTNDGIERATTKRLPEATIDEAWSFLAFTSDPLPRTLERTKDDAVEVGLLDPVDLDGIYDLAILNEARTARSRPAVGR